MTSVCSLILVPQCVFIIIGRGSSFSGRAEPDEIGNCQLMYSIGKDLAKLLLIM